MNLSGKRTLRKLKFRLLLIFLGIFAIVLLSVTFTKAEGTKELQPQGENNNRLAAPVFEGNSDWGVYGASADERILTHFPILLSHK